MRKAGYLAILAVLLLALFASGCKTPWTANPSLTIIEHYWTKKKIVDQWVVEITGKAQNTGNCTLSYAEIWATFYDPNDTVIKQTFTNKLDLGKGQLWHFWIYDIIDSEPHRYHLETANLSY